MNSVRFRTLFALLAMCSVFTGFSTSAAWADGGSSSQLLDVSNQTSDLQNQITNAQQHGQQFKQGQLSSGAVCGYGTSSAPFGQFGDSGSYASPLGADPSGWTLEHASVTGDHDPFTTAQDSLSLPSNGKATTTPICIGTANTAVRLMVKNNGATNSDLRVTLFYENPDGSVHNATLAKLQAGPSWQPSISIPLGISALAASYPNGTAVIELQFQPEGLGGTDTWSIDGLNVAQSPGPPPTGVTTTATTTTQTPPATPPAATTAPSPTITDPTQLIDISHQVADIQHKIADLQSKGQVAKHGQLSLAATCGYQNPAQIFAPWGDAASYSLAPGGDLSQTGGWTFHNASPVTDHDPFTTGTTSLAFTRGDSQAVTPAMCVNLTNPTIRMFLRDSGGNGKSDIKVTVLYEDTNGNTQHLDLARVRATSNWSPSITIPIGVNLLSTASASGLTAVAFQFKVEGLQNGETLSLDNLYVDPFCGR